MNRFIFLLAAMLSASLAALPASAADAAKAEKAQVKKPGAVKPAGKTQNKAKPKGKVIAKPAAPAAPANPYLAASTSLSKPGANPYLPGNDLPVVRAPNPYLPQAAAPAVQPAAVAAAAAAPALALSLSQSLARPPVATTVEVSEPPKPAEPVKPVDQVVTVTAPSPAAARPAGNPYLMYSYAYNGSPAMNLSNPLDSLGHTWSDIKNLLPSLPTSDMAILPTLKKVYPTGEKPLYVLTFKCPTEVVGITPIPTKALHWLVTAGMDAVNATDLLPFNMQQVCQ